MRYIMWVSGYFFRMTESQYIHVLIKALSSNTRRFEAAYALIELGGKAVEPLIEALDDEVPEVRATAATAILNIGAPAMEPLMRSLDSGRSKNPELLACILSTLDLESEGRDDRRLIANTA